MESRGLVLYWAKRYAPLLQGRAAVDFDDLTQAGFLGLLEAAQTFDSSKGAWSAWASLYIRKAMLEALGLRGRKPEPFVLSLDAPAYTDDGEPSEVTLLETLADPANPDIDGLLLEDEIVKTVRAAVDDLPEDQRDVIRLHDLEGFTLKQCGERLNLPPGRPAQYVRRDAIKKLVKDKRLRSLALDPETRFYAHKGVQAFFSSGSSVVEDAVIRREELFRRFLNGDKGESIEDVLL